MLMHAQVARLQKLNGEEDWGSRFQRGKPID